MNRRAPPGGAAEEAAEDVDPLTLNYRYAKVESVFNRLDVGGNGSISFAEFLTQVEKLTPDELRAARSAFDMLGPDKDGNVKRRKYIEMQLAAFEDVSDAEFNRWVYIMTKGSVVHAHRRKELEAAGVPVPEDYIEPPMFSAMRVATKLAQAVSTRVYRKLFASAYKREVAAYEMSATARSKHIRRIGALQARLDLLDSSLLDDQHALALKALEEKTKNRGTLLPPKQRMTRRPMLEEVEEEIDTRERRERAVQLTKMMREEKEADPSSRRGLKLGNEEAPLFIEATEPRLRAAREQNKKTRELRLARDLAGKSNQHRHHDARLDTPTSANSGTKEGGAAAARGAREALAADVRSAAAPAAARGAPSPEERLLFAADSSPSRERLRLPQAVRSPFAQLAPMNFFSHWLDRKAARVLALDRHCSMPHIRSRPTRRGGHPAEAGSTSG
eukprot:CAMPEP_0202095114 /NCGR_PEP_ID=MMETSP0964-20121228/49379_1 /ASSEMBLY_ACC=CAM_ASM_000500 /TAXON_ID=4773 /ORGANISM="Schizochytrium aggregatum, Strain ATCC28209" /LENGTH=445 /DNA_ID=CAMNT_0048663369 /DNA_START=1 /DNA_END=1339 /DNA_ORIENTATION=+